MATTRIDVSQVENFAKRLALASQLIEEEGDDFADEWGEKWVEEMVSVVPVRTGALRNSIRQVEPGGITMGVPYWRFLEHGTSKMSPQPFVRPAMQRIRKPAKDDAGRRVVRLMQRGI